MARSCGINVPKAKIIYDQKNILRTCIAPLIKQHAVNSEFEWEVADAQGELLLDSDTLQNHNAFVGVTLPAGLPEWILLFYPYEKIRKTFF